MSQMTFRITPVLLWDYDNTTQCESISPVLIRIRKKKTRTIPTQPLLSKHNKNYLTDTKFRMISLT